MTKMNINKYLTVDQTLELAIQNHQKDSLEDAIKLYQKVIAMNQNYPKAYDNLGAIFAGLEEYQKAKECFEKAIDVNPKYISAFNNLGNIFHKLGESEKAINSFEKAIEIDPNFKTAYYNLGLIFLDGLGKAQKVKAINCYENAIKIDPNYIDAYWNLYNTSSNIDEALSILKKILLIDHKLLKPKIITSALQAYKGNFDRFNNLLTSQHSNHSFVRSIKWIFSLPTLPKIFFNRLDFFDAVIKLSDNSRPFYEFGVWNGVSFQYLINAFKKGFGFDTFSGLPEAWYNMPKGSYSSFGAVPRIEGGEFIVGKFEDTLPDFFSKERPMASLINFDADLYSSTLCALNYSNKVIDEKTILIFDELIMNENWEQDEFKALNEFCDNSGFTYEVIAFSFSTKQVAVKLKK